MLAELRDLFVRDLERLTAQLEAYPSEESVWVVPDGVLNSGGTLVLHLVGNLSQFVGLELGGVPFVRDRAAEFARRDVSRAELLALLAGVREAVVWHAGAPAGVAAGRGKRHAAAGLSGGHDGRVLSGAPVRAPELAPGAAGLPPPHDGYGPVRGSGR